MEIGISAAHIIRDIEDIPTVVSFVEMYVDSNLT